MNNPSDVTVLTVPAAFSEAMEDAIFSDTTVTVIRVIENEDGSFDYEEVNG